MPQGPFNLAFLSDSIMLANGQKSETYVQKALSNVFGVLMAKKTTTVLADTSGKITTDTTMPCYAIIMGTHNGLGIYAGNISVNNVPLTLNTFSEIGYDDPPHYTYTNSNATGMLSTTNNTTWNVSGNGEAPTIDYTMPGLFPDYTTNDSIVHVTSGSPYNVTFNNSNTSNADPPRPRLQRGCPGPAFATPVIPRSA